MQEFPTQEKQTPRSWVGGGVHTVHYIRLKLTVDLLGKKNRLSKGGTFPVPLIEYICGITVLKHVFRCLVPVVLSLSDPEFPEFSRVRSSPSLLRRAFF